MKSANMRSANMKAAMTAATCLVLALAMPAGAADWKATENTAHYAISGSTPLALYQSIGDKGPKTSTGTRAIALTTWDLKWRRDYQRRDKGCVLASALPFLSITYTLPKPATSQSGATAQSWGNFYAGIKAHELQHGAMLKTMTQAIINQTVGLATQSDDGNCNQLRANVLKNVKAAFDSYTRQSREFDRVEMSKGGNVHQLVLALVNG